jgi:hypothetical protein
LSIGGGDSFPVQMVHGELIAQRAEADGKIRCETYLIATFYRAPYDFERLRAVSSSIAPHRQQGINSEVGI